MDFEALHETTGLTRDGLVQMRRALGASEIMNVLEDPTIRAGTAHLVNYRNPLRMNIPRKGPGSAGQSSAYVTRHTAGTTPAQFINDTDEPAENTGTPSRVSFQFRTLLGRIKITRLAQLMGRSYVDVFQQEMGFKIADFRNFEERWLIAGDNAVESDEWDGINKLVPTDKVFNAADTAGTNGALTEKILRELIDGCRGASPMFHNEEGMPSAALLTSDGGGREMDALISSRQRINEANVMVNGGFRMRTYDDIPIFRTNTFGSKIYHTVAKPTRSELTAGTTGGSTVMYCLNFEELWVEELEMFNIVPLATTSSQFDHADIREVCVPVLRNTESISMLTGIQVS